jgi:hypothetical protein
MEPYKNKSKTSGVTNYEIGEDYIGIKFKGKSTVYIYSESVIDKEHIDAMKKLAISGRGLGTYISQHPSVRNGYKKR